MNTKRLMVGAAVAGLLFVVACGDDSNGGGNAACESLCSNVSSCDVSVPGCLSECETASSAAFVISSACGNAFNSVASCAGGLSCEQLADLVSGGMECESEIQACDEACGAGTCDFDDALSP